MGSKDHETALRQAREAGQRAMQAQQWAAAAAAFERATVLRPDLPQCWFELLQARVRLGEWPPAEAAARRLVALAPRQPQSHKVLVQCLLEQGRHADAAQACAAMPPDLPRDLQWLEMQATALFLAGNAGAALTVYAEIARRDPANPLTHFRLGLLTRELRQATQAARHFEQALQRDPEARQRPHAAVRTLLVEQLSQQADWAGRAAHETALRRGLEDERVHAAVEPFPLLALELPADLRLRIARAHARTRQGRIAALPDAPRQARPDGRLRIAYLSCDFHHHATAMLIAGLLESHDRARFEIHLYCHSREDGSPLQQRLRAAATHHPIGTLSDAEVARQMRADGIDIAIDLKGYTTGTRMQLLAHRPAPLQLSFLGYPGTTGAEFIDYVVGDPVVTPLSLAEDYSERIAQMPHSYQPNDGRRALPPAPSRAALGLPDGSPVLCCFNQTYKITPEVADLWAAILRARPEAVLWLLDWNPDARGHLREQFTTRGVEAGRLVFAPQLPLEAHLARLQCADLFLDTWPYNAHTTASEALWAGVPVLTVPGRSFAARVAASLLTACELPAFICDGPEAYVARAVALLREPSELRHAQEHLRSRRHHLPLFDSPRHARDFEALLQRMWALHEAGEAPQHLPA